LPGNRHGGSNPSLSANLRQPLAPLAASVGRPRQASIRGGCLAVARSAKAGLNPHRPPHPSPQMSNIAALRWLGAAHPVEASPPDPDGLRHIECPGRV